MNIEILKNKLQELLQIEKENLQKVEDQTNLDKDLNSIISKLSSGDTDIDLESLRSIFELSKDIDIAKLEELIKLFSFKDIMSEERKKELAKYLNEQIANIKRYQQELESKYKGKRESLLIKISTYEKYSSLIVANEIVKPLSIEEFPLFLEFLNTLDLDPSIIQDLIIEFYNYNMKFYEKEREIKDVRTTNQIKGNAKKIRTELNKPVESLDIDAKLEEIIASLANSEKEIVEKIKEIYDELKTTATINDNETFKVLLNGNYSIEDHLEVIKLESDIPSAIITDLAVYLIPNYSTHSIEILEIFKDIIKLYEETEVKEESNAKMSYEIDEETLTQLDLTASLVDQELEVFDILSPQDQMILDSMYELVLSNQVDDARKLSPKFSVTDAIYYNKLKTFKEKFISLKDMLANQKDYIEILGEEDVIVTIKNYIDELNELSIEINRLDSDRKPIIKEDSKQVLKPQNLVIFPYGGSSIIENIQDIKSKNDYQFTYERTSVALDKLIYPNYIEIGQRDHLISPHDDIPDHRDVAKPFNVRSDNIRIGYISVGISRENLKVLQEKYDLDENFHIYLAFCVYYKTESIYVKQANSDFHRHIDEIIRIKNLFSHPFTEESLKEAKKLIDKSIELIKQIKDNTKSLDLEETMNGGGR